MTRAGKIVRPVCVHEGVAGVSSGYVAGMTHTDDRPREVVEQAKRHAEQSRAAMEEKRDKQEGGVSGWVAKRAGKWDLDGQDEASLQRQKFFWNALVDYWFRMDPVHAPGRD